MKGLKVDFMQRDDQKMVGFYERVVKEAARRKLLIDFHGAYKPTGLRRRYPNLITREGVYGLEQNKWTDRPSIGALERSRDGEAHDVGIALVHAGNAASENVAEGSDIAARPAIQAKVDCLLSPAPARRRSYPEVVDDVIDPDLIEPT